MPSVPSPGTSASGSATTGSTSTRRCPELFRKSGPRPWRRGVSPRRRGGLAARRGTAAGSRTSADVFKDLGPLCVALFAEALTLWSADLGQMTMPLAWHISGFALIPRSAPEGTVSHARPLGLVPGLQKVVARALPESALEDLLLQWHREIGRPPLDGEGLRVDPLRHSMGFPSARRRSSKGPPSIYTCSRGSVPSELVRCCGPRLCPHPHRRTPGKDRDAVVVGVRGRVCVGSASVVGTRPRRSHPRFGGGMGPRQCRGHRVPPRR